jgi:multidrug/hemolysin transport system ATP-binding protein
MEKIIEVSGLKKSFKQVQAVKGIDFYVEAGTLFAFLGPNGAGKTTSIEIICTLLKPDEGDVTVARYRP